MERQTFRMAFSVAFMAGGRQWVFQPNGYFWMLLLAAVLAVGWLALGEGLSYWAMQVPEGEKPVSWEVWDGISTFSAPVALSSGVMLSLLLRWLIDFLIRLEKIELLGQGSRTQGLVLHAWNRRLPFHLDRRLLWRSLGALAVLLAAFAYLHGANAQMEASLAASEAARQQAEQALQTHGLASEAEMHEAWADSEQYRQDVIGYAMEHLRRQGEQDAPSALQRNYRDAFLVQKQLMTADFLIREKVSRLDQLNSRSLIELNRKIAGLFEELVLGHIAMPAHVQAFFSDTNALDKLETALMEQAKYHVPASIKLAQAALETAYGRRVVNNNYFGIKDRAGKAPAMETVEYYNDEEARINASKIIAKERVSREGKKLWKCRVRDSFMQYGTAWESFRAHSLFLSENPRYHALFAGGKDYKMWAERIGSTKYGGVGYATSPVYGELLKKIIERYALDLLDY